MGKKTRALSALQALGVIDAPPVKDGKNGRNGVDGKSGMPGLNGVDGARGEHGKDGRDGVGFSWCGEYAMGVEYCSYDVVQYNGSVYIALESTWDAPDVKSGTWDLMVRAGKDGKGRGGDLRFGYPATLPGIDGGTP